MVSTNKHTTRMRAFTRLAPIRMSTLSRIADVRRRRCRLRRHHRRRRRQRQLRALCVCSGLNGVPGVGFQQSTWPSQLGNVSLNGILLCVHVAD